MNPIAAAVLALITAVQPDAAHPLKAPPVVDPGPYVGPATPPADAVVLFDGSSLDAWARQDGKPAGWALDRTPGGAMTIAPNSGSIVTRRSFGDAQIHVEFMTPVESGEGQDRGNSGVYLQGRYEVQVLDSYRNETYPDGQCGAIYGKHVPLVNASRPPGQWQTYDILYHAARFGPDGKKITHARVTVLHNGLLIHDNVEIPGPTGGAISPESAEPGPILLQDHGHEVKYRNIWVRPL
jgi:hypothetical protein